MAKLFPLIGIFLFSLSPCLGQNNHDRSIHEIQSLISKSGADTNRIRLLLEGGLQYAKRPGALKSNFDSALHYSDQALQLSISLNTENWEGKCWVVYSIIYRQKNDTPKGKSYVHKAIDVFKKHGDKTELGKAYMELANYYSTSEKELSEKIRLTRLAVQLFDQAGDWELKASELMNIEDLYEDAKDHDSAMFVLHQALNIYEKIHYTELQLVYDRLGCVSQEMGKSDDAMKYEILAMKIAESHKDSSSEMAIIYNELAVTYYNLGQLPQAIQYYQNSLFFAEKNNDTARIATVVQGVVNAYDLADKPLIALNLLKSIERRYTFSRAEDGTSILSAFLACYAKLKDFNSAKPYVKQLISISERYPVTDKIQAQTFGYIIYYYLKAREYKNMPRYCSLYEMYCKKNELPYYLCIDYGWWYQADSALGDYVTAFHHFQLYSNMRDSLIGEKQTRETSRLQIQYETEGKEKNIRLLTQKNQLQQAQLKQTKLIKNFILGGSVMLMFSLGLGYNRYRLKQRSNRRLEAQQLEINRKNETLGHLLEEKDWLIKEIHHRVKNNLQIVMSLLNTQSSYLSDTAAVKAIAESQHRMHAMSLIHQKLYQSENVSTVDMKQYISELIGYLDESYDIGIRIHFTKEIENIKLDVAQAIPIGLILNEAVTNSIKYAFKGKNNGRIHVSLIATPGNRLKLTIADNGIGLPGTYDIDKSSSLGMNLVKGLAKQLEGTFEIKNSDGLSIAIEFPYVVGSVNAIEVLTRNSSNI